MLIDAASAEAERIAFLRAELLHMTQLKDIAETRASALSLLGNGNGSRTFDPVHSLSVRTGDYTGHTEEDVYSQQPMDFAQYKRFTASISSGNNNNNVQVQAATHPNNHPHTSDMSTVSTSNNNNNNKSNSNSNSYSYPPITVPTGRSYALDDFQGSDDSYAANLAGQRNGQRPSRYVGMTRNIPNGTPKPYLESETRYNGSENNTVPSPRSRLDANYLNGIGNSSADVAASRGHGLSSSLCNGYPSRQLSEDLLLNGLNGHGQALGQGLGQGQELRRGEGQGVHVQGQGQGQVYGQGYGLKEMTQDRGSGRHSPTPSPPTSFSRSHIEQALRMCSDDDSDIYAALDRRYDLNGVHDRHGINERNGSSYDVSKEERTNMSQINTTKESIEEKSDTSSPVSERSCSPVTRKKKIKIKSPWVNTFKASPNWNYSPPIHKQHTGDTDESPEELAGTPPKDTVDPAGKHSKELRSIDDYFLQ